MVELAREAFYTKNFDLAVEIYQRTISENGPSFDLYLGLADSCARSGQLVEAFSAYTKAFRIGRSNLSPSKLENLVIGLIDFTKKLDKDKLNIMEAPKLEMFDCLLCCGLLTEPISLPCGHTFCQSCLVKDGSKQCKNCGKVHFYLNNKSYRTNILISSTINKLFPNDVLAAMHKSAGNKLYGSRKYAEAIDEYSKALKYAPHDHLVLSNRSIAYSSLDKHTEALADAVKCVLERPDWAKGYFRKGKALSDLGKKEDACHAFLQCLSIDPNIAVAKEALGKELHRLLSPSDVVDLNKHCEVRTQRTLRDLLGIQSVNHWLPSAENISQLRASIKSQLQSGFGFLDKSVSAPASRELSPVRSPNDTGINQGASSLKRARTNSGDAAEDGANCSNLKVSKSETDVSSHISGHIKAFSFLSLDSQDFECALCFRLFYEPVSTPCGHTFCRGCLDRALDHSAACPLCKSSLAEYLAGGKRTRVELIDYILKSGFPELTRERKKIHEEELAALNHAGNGEQEIPVFVCTNAYPSVACPLHVFEPRYRLMIRQCMESGTRQFGMTSCLSDDENDFAEYGTMLEIRDVQYFPDGRSVVDCIGGRRFRVKSKGTRDGYCTAKVEWVADCSPDSDEELEGIKKLCSEIYNQSSKWFKSLPNPVRSRINQINGEFPEMDSNLPLLPSGPKWLWWVLNVLPLNPRNQISIIAMCSLKDRLNALRNALTYLNQKRSK